MPGQVRIEFPGATYHCTARGDRREDFVRRDEERVPFVAQLGELMLRTGWEVFACAWLLMSNHHHRVLQTPEPNRVAGMRRLAGRPSMMIENLD